MYSNFAEFYDELTDDVGYEERAKYLCSLFEKFDRAPTLLLDLACGTGGFSREFAQKGISVIGVDISEEMLAVATEKNFEEKLDILYLCQDAAELDLYGTVDGAVCCLDSINHITDYDTLCAAFKKVSLFLEDERLFIFDVNTIFKHEQILADNTFVIENDDIYCVWQNEYDSTTRTTEIMLDLFRREGDMYTRSFENIFERAYTEDEIKTALESANLSIIGIFGDMSVSAPESDEQRIIFVTRKEAL